MQRMNDRNADEDGFNGFNADFQASLMPLNKYRSKLE